MSRLARDVTAEPVSRNQILRRERVLIVHGNINFPCFADHEPDLQPYPVDPYSLLYVINIYTWYIYIYTYMAISHRKPHYLSPS